MTQHPLLTATKLALIDLTDLLLQENEDLRARKLDRVTTNVKRKNELAGNVEALLLDVKALQEKGETLERNQVNQLQNALDEYQTHARQNMLLLKAAHEATADFLLLVKQTLDAKQGTTKTYGSQGHMTTQENPEKRSFINKAV
jgi:hypothetical protein